MNRCWNLPLKASEVDLELCTTIENQTQVMVNAVELTDVARMELAESGTNKPGGLGLCHRFIQVARRRGVKSTVLQVMVEV